MAYGLTKSLDIEKSSTQAASRADDTAFDLGTTYTIEAWIKAESLPSDATNNAIVGKWLTTGNQRSYVFRLNNASGTYTLQMVHDSDGSAGGSVVSSSDAFAISTGVWYHIAVVVTSNVTQFYVNGVDYGGGDNLGNQFNSSASITVGAERADGTDGWDGLISLVRVWKGVARSQSQIADNACEVLGATTGLSAEWTLDDVYTDNSGNGFTLSPLNTPVFATDVPAVCVVTNVTVNPSAQVATFSIPAYSVLFDRVVSVNTQVSTFSIPAFVVSLPKLIAANVQVATFTIPAYTIDAGGNITVAVGVSTVTMSIPAYSVLKSWVQAVNTMVATFSTPTPTTSEGTGVTVQPSAQVVTMTIPAYAVVVVANKIVAVAAQVLTFSLPTLAKVGAIWRKVARSTSSTWSRTSRNSN